jgi:hypothetical protein
MTTPATNPFPVADKIEEAHDALNTSHEKVEAIVWALQHVTKPAVEPREGEWPTFDDVGRLLSFSVDLRSRAAELAELSADVRKLADLVDGVRGANRLVSR